MDFTEIYRQTAGLVAPSPVSDGEDKSPPWILTAFEDRLIVRRADTFQIARAWTVDTTHSPASQIIASSSRSRPGSGMNDAWITHIGWSCDSKYIFACCAKRNIVNVFSLDDEQWSARIEGGVEGLVKAEWAPDGRTILCFSEWGVSRLIRTFFT